MNPGQLLKLFVFSVKGSGMTDLTAAYKRGPQDWGGFYIQAVDVLN
jgi:hypothetical protein